MQQNLLNPIKHYIYFSGYSNSVHISDLSIAMIYVTFDSLAMQHFKQFVTLTVGCDIIGFSIFLLFSHLCQKHF